MQTKTKNAKQFYFCYKNVNIKTIFGDYKTKNRKNNLIQKHVFVSLCNKIKMDACVVVFLYVHLEHEIDRK